MLKHITSAASAATHTLETMDRKAFRSLVTKAFGYGGQKGAFLRGGYRMVEYFNSPHGLIVYAHRADDQVDGIHPASLSESIRSFRNIIEPLHHSRYEGTKYNVHYMTRRSQGV